MKTLLSIGCLLLIFCGNKEPKAIAKAKQTTKITAKGTVTLMMNGNTFVYDKIDWEKSRIKHEEDISLSIRQENLPQLKFKFPEIEKSLAGTQGIFTIPDIHRRGFSPITLNFIVTDKDSKREAVTFRKGQVKVSFENNTLKMEFEGEGGPTLDDSIKYPIGGKLHITI